MIVVTDRKDDARKEASFSESHRSYHPHHFQIMLGLNMAEEKRTCMRVFFRRDFFQRDFFRRDFFKGNIHK